MARPELYHLGRLRALRGDALVTYPYGSTSYKRVERVYTVERGQGEKTFLIADAEYTGTKLTQQRIVGGDHLFVEIYQRYDTIPGPVLTSVVYDLQTKSYVTESRQMVAASEAIPTAGARLTSFRDVPNNVLTKQRIIKEYPSDITSKTITTYEPDNYTYPAILHSIATATATKLDGSTLATVTPVIEAARPKQITKRITRTFTTSAPSDGGAISGIYSIEPVVHRYAGVLFSVNTPPVLSDAISLSYTTGSGDPTWGTVVETYTKTASVPTKTAYLSARSGGSWLTIYRGSKLIAEGLWMTTEVAIPAL